MKKILNFLTLILFLFLVSCNQEFNPKITKITPEKYLALKNNIKKKTIIHFWFSYCEPCIRDFPELMKITEENNIDLINISSDKSDSKMQDNLEKVMKKLSISECYIIDFKNLYPNGTKMINVLEDFAKKINLKEYSNPYYILIDENGKTIVSSYELKDIKKHLN